MRRRRRAAAGEAARAARFDDVTHLASVDKIGCMTRVVAQSITQAVRFVFSRPWVRTSRQAWRIDSRLFDSQLICNSMRNKYGSLIWSTDIFEGWVCVHFQHFWKLRSSNWLLVFNSIFVSFSLFLNYKISFSLILNSLFNNVINFHSHSLSTCSQDMFV